MIWYFNEKTDCFQYPDDKEVSNDLVKRFHYAVYEDSDEMELYYALSYMKDNKINKLSVVFPIISLSVNYGKSEDINRDYKKKSAMKYRYEQRSGGTMVFFPGNVITLDIYPTDNFLRQHLYLSDLVAYLDKMGVKAVTNNNDVMVDDKKVVGALSETLPAPYDKWVYFAVAVSINSDAELIDEVCSKKMDKVPGALSDYKVTTDDIVKFTLEWFNTHQNYGGPEEKEYEK